MKKLVLLIAFVFIGMASQAQSSVEAVSKIAQQDLKIMEMKITKYYPNLKFNASQNQRLTSIFTKRAEEVYQLRSQEALSKDDYYVAYKELESKYNSEIEAVLSVEQKTVYLRKVKAQLQRD